MRGCCVLLFSLCTQAWGAARAQAAAAPVVEGPSTCPDPAAVSRRLAPLVPVTEGESARRVWLSRTGNELSLELRDGAGPPLASRRLSVAREGCDALAAAAAVVIATWEVELRGRGAVSLVLDRPPPVLAPLPPETGWTVALGLGGFASRAGDSWAPAAVVDVEAGPGGSALHGILSLTGVAAHSQPLGTGSARWQRVAIGLGARLIAATQRLRADASVEGRAAWLGLVGDGFDRDRVDSALDLGGAAALRGGVRWGGFFLWGGATLCAWPTSRSLEVMGLRQTAEMPKIQALLGGGLSIQLEQIGRR